MCSMSVLCPLCAQTSFSSIDALRCSLIKAANGPLACPICSELFLGLDKLTIHLFGHTNIMINSANNVNATTTPTTHNQNIIENIEKFKTQQIENTNNSSNCNDSNKITKTHLNGELNFDNTHHHLQENNMIEKPKEANNKKDTTTIVNKSNSNQQPQQVATTTSGGDHDETGEKATLAQCDICEFTFRNEELRNMHIRLVHQNIECHNNVNGSFERSTTLTPTTTSPVHDCRNSQINHEFKCHLCAKTFKTKGSLRIHLKVVHLMGLPYVNNTPKLTICDRIRHKENKILKIANPTPNNTQLQSEPTLEYESSNNCNLFNISPINFISNLNTIPPPAASNISVVNLNQPLEYHEQNNLDKSTIQTSNVLLVFNTSGTAENKETSLNSITNNDNSKATALIISKENDVAFRFNSYMANVTENPKIWECDVCSKAFTTKYFLKKHKRLHTGEMPYTCELCARTFTFQQSYHKHLLYHSDEKPHVCFTCGRAFKELSTLHNHERIHSGEKPFKCDVCGKSFRQRVSFLVHSRIHTGVMPYKCEMCKRSFRYKVSQRTHKCQSLSTEDATTTPQDEKTNDNMSDNFMKAFLESSVANQADSQLNQSQNSPASNEIAFINEKASSSLNEQEALLAKTIDDIVVESCNRMGIGNDALTQQQLINEGSMSPSQKLQNMRLYSPQLVTPDLNGIEGDLTRFFLQSSPSGNNLM